MSDNDKREMFCILDRDTGHKEGVYTRGNYDKYEFTSVYDALNANCHGIHHDRGRYRIAKYRVTVELIDPDVEWDADSPKLCPTTFSRR